MDFEDSSKYSSHLLIEKREKLAFNQELCSCTYFKVLCVRLSMFKVCLSYYYWRSWLSSNHYVCPDVGWNRYFSARPAESLALSRYFMTKGVFSCACKIFRSTVTLSFVFDN
jgi:hypothetical protein